MSDPKLPQMDYPATIVPPLTPFNANGKVDYDMLKGIVDYTVEDCAASMVIAAGVEAQEYQFLTMDERRELIFRTIEFTAGRRPVVVGISHPSFNVALELADFATAKGAAALQLLAPQRPTGGPPSTAELVGYFEAVTQRISLPLMLYLNAGPGADVSLPATVELSKIDGIAYVKESSRDMTRVGRLIAEIELAGQARYFTTMQMLLPSLMLGGTGCTLPPPAAKVAMDIIGAFKAKNFEEAARLQGQFNVFPSRWMGNGLAAVMKAALNHLGVPAGEPYPPYKPLAGAELDALKAHLGTTDFKPKGH
jgi:4-hydroxy-tetrahydrodipicolinate synthase